MGQHRAILQHSHIHTSPKQSHPLSNRPAVLPRFEPVSVPPAQLTVVTTAAELQAASVAGAQDIEIRAHLDLSSLRRFFNPRLPPITGDESKGPHALLYAYGNMRSMRVRGFRWHCLRIMLQHTCAVVWMCGYTQYTGKQPKYQNQPGIIVDP